MLPPEVPSPAPAPAPSDGLLTSPPITGSECRRGRQRWGDPALNRCALGRTDGPTQDCPTLVRRRRWRRPLRTTGGEPYRRGLYPHPSGLVGVEPPQLPPSWKPRPSREVPSESPSGEWRAEDTIRSAPGRAGHKRMLGSPTAARGADRVQPAAAALYARTATPTRQSSTPAGYQFKPLIEAKPRRTPARRRPHTPAAHGHHALGRRQTARRPPRPPAHAWLSAWPATR